MRYLKILILILLLLLPILAVSYFYLKVKIPTISTNISDNEARPFETPANRRNLVTDYTLADVKSNDTVIVKGYYQTYEKEEKTVNDVTYPYVVGVLEVDESVSRIWLTSDQFDIAKDRLFSLNLRSGDSVLIKINKDSISFERTKL